MITDHIEVIFEDLAALTMWTNYTVYSSYLIIFMCVWAIWYTYYDIWINSWTLGLIPKAIQNPIKHLRWRFLWG